MTGARAAIAASWIVLGACSRSSAVVSDAGVFVVDAPATQALHADDAAAAAIPSATASTPRPPPAPCRAMAVTGAVRSTRESDDGEHPLATGDAIPSWVELAAGARLTAKEPRSGRELAFTGVASAFPCAGESEAWLASGVLTSARGSGERPGADQWIVTPFAVVRYGAAIVEVTVDAVSTRAVLRGGGASALANEGDSWHSIDAATPFVARGALDSDASTATTSMTTALANRCAQTGREAKALRDQLLAPDATRAPGFGDLAKRTTETEILARAVCAMAVLRTEVQWPSLHTHPR